jgi:hypothetical protein
MTNPDDFGPEASLAEILRRTQDLPEEQLLRERVHHSNAAIKSAVSRRTHAKLRRLGKLDFTRRGVEPCRP